MNEENLTKYMDKLDSILDFQVLNGLISSEASRSMRENLKCCRRLLAENDLTTAKKDAHCVFDAIVTELGKKPIRARLLYFYGVHVLTATLVFSTVLLYLLVAGYLTSPILGGYYPATLAWGGLGGSAYTIFYLRKNIWEYTFSKTYAVYWMVYPAAGMFFGFAAGLVGMVGVITINRVSLSPDSYYVLAFLAGMFQQWIIGTLRDVAYAIHTPSSEK